MRIEILVDNEEPKIYPLDRPKILVGSHEACDIVINHKSISRKHLTIVKREDAFFVSDQGSTNGCFINEERLVPGSSSEFTSFFPVRLGDNVLMTLLSDEEAQDLGPDSEFNTQNSSAAEESHETTQMISLKDLHKSNTADLVKKRTETVSKRKTVKALPKKKPVKISNSTLGFICFLFLGGAAYFQFLLNENNDSDIVVATQIIKEPVVEVVDESPITRVEEGDLPSAEKILAAFKEPKCTKEIEKYLCNKYPFVFQGIYGPILIDKTIIIMGNGNKYSSLAKDYVIAPPSIETGGTKAALTTYQVDLGLISLMLWMKDNLSSEVSTLEGMNDLTITIAMIDSSNKEVPSLISAAVFVPGALPRLRRRMQEKHFTEAKTKGASEFSYALEYLRFL